VVDRLRLLWNRPLRDADRRRLFAVACALIAAAAALLALLERPARTAPAERPPRAPAASPPALPEPVASPAAPDEPPDEGTPAPVAVSRAEVAAGKRAARRFLAGYLEYAYGRREAAEIRAATSALRRRLAAERPRVPARERRRAAELVLVQSDAVGRERAGFSALVDDGRRRYTVALDLVATPAGWRVARVGS
jgi:hypothetical protein